MNAQLKLTHGSLYKQWEALECARHHNTQATSPLCASASSSVKWGQTTAHQGCCEKRMCNAPQTRHGLWKTFNKRYYFEARIASTWTFPAAQLIKNPPAIQETWVRPLGWEDPLEKGKATSSTLAWTIQFMGLQRVRQDWATFILLLLVTNRLLSCILLLEGTGRMEGKKARKKEDEEQGISSILIKVKMLAAQSWPILWDHMDCSPPGSSVHGIFQARTLEWVAISFSRGSSWPRNRTQVSCIAGRFFTVWATWGLDKFLPMKPL